MTGLPCSRGGWHLTRSNRFCSSSSLGLFFPEWVYYESAVSSCPLTCALPRGGNEFIPRDTCLPDMHGTGVHSAILSTLNLQ